MYVCMYVVISEKNPFLKGEGEREREREREVYRISTFDARIFTFVEGNLYL